MKHITLALVLLSSCIFANWDTLDNELLDDKKTSLNGNLTYLTHKRSNKYSPGGRIGYSANLSPYINWGVELSFSRFNWEHRHSVLMNFEETSTVNPSAHSYRDLKDNLRLKVEREEKDSFSYFDSEVFLGRPYAFGPFTWQPRFGLYLGTARQKRKLKEIVPTEGRAKWGPVLSISDYKTIGYEVTSRETKERFLDEKALRIGAILGTSLEWNLFRYMSLTSYAAANSYFELKGRLGLEMNFNVFKQSRLHIGLGYEVMNKHLIIGDIPLIFYGYSGQLSWEF